MLFWPPGGALLIAASLPHKEHMEPVDTKDTVSQGDSYVTDTTLLSEEEEEEKTILPC